MGTQEGQGLASNAHQTGRFLGGRQDCDSNGHDRRGEQRRGSEAAHIPSPVRSEGRGGHLGRTFCFLTLVLPPLPETALVQAFSHRIYGLAPRNGGRALGPGGGSSPVTRRERSDEARHARKDPDLRAPQPLAPIRSLAGADAQNPRAWRGLQERNASWLSWKRTDTSRSAHPSENQDSGTKGMAYPDRTPCADGVPRTHDRGTPSRHVVVRPKSGCQLATSEDRMVLN